jgi:hypothetical protein
MLSCATVRKVEPRAVLARARSGVHASGAGGAVDVRGVPGQEGPASGKGGGAVVEPEVGRPHRITQ